MFVAEYVTSYSNGTSFCLSDIGRGNLRVHNKGLPAVLEGMVQMLESTASC